MNLIRRIPTTLDIYKVSSEMQERLRVCGQARQRVDTDAHQIDRVKDTQAERMSLQ